MSESPRAQVSFPYGRLLDFHTHILPEVDDGSRSVIESVRMLNESVRQGVICAVLTPHFYASSDDPGRFLARRARALARLQSAYSRTSPVLIPGAEVQYFSGITAMEELPELCIGNTNLLLLEMPSQRWPRYVWDDLTTIRERYGVRIVIAHIERYIGMQPRGSWEALVQSGHLVQVNAGYILSRFTRRRAVRMLEDGMIHFLGSDCHNMRKRPPRMGACARVLREEWGGAQMDALTAEGIRLLAKKWSAAPHAPAPHAPV